MKMRGMWGGTTKVAALASILVCALNQSGWGQGAIEVVTEPRLLLSRGRPWDAALSPDGAQFLIGNFDAPADISTFDADTGRLVARVTQHVGPWNPNWGTIGAYSPDNAWVISGGDRGDIFVWDAATGEMRWQEGTRGSMTLEVGFSPSGQYAAAAFQYAVRAYDAVTGAVLLDVTQLEEQRYQPLYMGFLPDDTLVTAGPLPDAGTGSLAFWQLPGGTLLRHFENNLWNTNLWGLAFAVSPDGARIVGSHVTPPVGVTLRVVDAATGEVTQSYSGHEGQIQGAAWWPDSSRVATVSSDGRVHIWDPLTGTRYFTLSLRAPGMAWYVQNARGADISQDGTRLLAAAGREMKIWSIPEEMSFREFRPGDTHTKQTPQIVGAILSRDGTRGAVGLSNGEVEVFDTESMASVRRWQAHENVIYTLAFSTDNGRLLTSGDGYYAAKVWDVETPGAPLLLDTDPYIVGAQFLGFSPEGGLIFTAASSDYDTQIRVWSSTTGELVRTIEASDEPGGFQRPIGAAFAPNSEQVAVLIERELKLFEATSGVLLHTFTSVDGADLLGFAFSGDSSELSGVSQTPTLHTWDAITGELLDSRRMPGIGDWAYTLNRIPGEPVVVIGTTVCNEQTGAYLYNLGTVPAGVAPSGELLFFDRTRAWLQRGFGWQAVHRYGGGKYSLYDQNNIAYSPDGRRLAATDLGVLVFDSATSELLMHRSIDTSNYERGILFVPGANEVAIGYLRTVYFYNADTGGQTRSLQLPNDISSFAFSQDGSRLAVVYSSSIRVVDATTHEALFPDLTGTPFGGGPGLQFSPDGQVLATANGGLVILWDMNLGVEWKRLNRWVTSDLTETLSWSPDGTTLLDSGLNRNGRTNTVWWDVESGEELGSFDGHLARFMPDGRHMLLAKGASVFIYDLVTQTAIKRFDWTGTTINGLACTPDGTEFSVSYASGIIAQWQTGLPPMDNRLIRPLSLSTPETQAGAPFLFHDYQLEWTEAQTGALVVRLQPAAGAGGDWWLLGRWGALPTLASYQWSGSGPAYDGAYTLLIPEPEPGTLYFSV
ncbi:MAG: hypothetical protein HYV26_11820, partial [Candidatus Hydrogenedentes bacterium]|nr:hypothetical protein [Candidatus Hydrogenedentota bacterium]